MSIQGLLSETLLPGRELRHLAGGIVSVLPAARAAGRYDRRAAAYDWIVGSTLYNRLAWGATTSRYRAFATRAVRTGVGPILDAGCGSALFSAAAYANDDRPAVLVDRSSSMLSAARARLARSARGTPPAHVALLQADLLDLPFRPDSFGTVLSMGMLHLFEDEDAVALVQGLAALLKPEGQLFLTTLVAEQAIARYYLAALHQAGEVATPRSAKSLDSLLGAAFRMKVEFEREGSMAYVVIPAGD